MPPLPNASSILKVRLVGFRDVSRWNNIFHVRYAGTAPTTADLEAYAATISGIWGTNLASLMSLNCSLTEVHMVDLTSPTAASAELAVTIPGTRAGSDFTGQVAAVSSWLANLRFRGGHFRTYWPMGMTNDTTNSTTWASSFRIAAQDGLTAFRTAINGASAGTAPTTLIGLSYFTQHALRPVPLAVDITGVAVHGRIDTQRRRLGKETV
jgi:hypothetical protein